MADYRIAYGPGPYQFGDLWLPQTGSSLPLVVFFHGGWWKSKYDLSYADPLCSALKKDGIAVWSVEYRRVGETGGGWPATFHDAAAGLDHAAALAQSYPLDLSRVFSMGHSAGGHLAFWVAGRHHVDAHCDLYEPHPRVALRGAISLAGAVDLGLTIRLSGNAIFAHDKDEVFALMGGTPEEFPDRYKAGNPGELLPFGAPQLLIQGTEDDQIPPGLPTEWAANARQRGDQAQVVIIPGADHDQVANPESHAWGAVRQAVHKMIFG